MPVRVTYWAFEPYLIAFSNEKELPPVRLEFEGRRTLWKYWQQCEKPTGFLKEVKTSGRIVNTSRLTKYFGLTSSLALGDSVNERFNFVKKSAIRHGDDEGD